MSDDTTISLRVDGETVEEFEQKIESEGLTKSEVLREYVNHIAEEGHYERSPFDAQINQLRREEREIRQEIENLESKREEVVRQRERLERKRSQYEDSKERLEGRLEAMDTQLRHHGMNIHRDTPAVKDAARDYDHTPDEIVEKMRDRNPDVPSHAFTHPSDPDAIGTWNGFDDPEIADRGLEERRR